jgi:hypothetical protein
MIPTMANFANLTIYIRNNTSKNLESATIAHTGKGGHPIKLGTIKALSNNTSEEMCILTSREKSNLVFAYLLDGINYSSVVYDNVIFSDRRPLIIDITEESGSLVFNTIPKSHENLK